MFPVQVSGQKPEDLKMAATPENGKSKELDNIKIF